MTTALYAGSFDPVHVGHLTIIERAASGFDAVVVAVVGNPSKQSGLFSMADRVRLVEEAVSHLPSVRCVRHAGLTVDLAAEVGADVLVRSVHKDASDEHTMALMNRQLTGIGTVFLAADRQTAWISSSRVRSLVARGLLEEVRALVPPPVFAALWQLAPAD